MIPFIIGFILGAIAVALILRNNAARAAKLDEQGRKLLDALKGK
jgi:hypothetical protein